VILLDSIHDAFIERLADAVMSLRIGTADDPATQVGPVIDSDGLRSAHSGLSSRSGDVKDGWWSIGRRRGPVMPSVRS
jgi:acyl-CoA reductase-like NAD-dependent aldehyde dehydrogenase